MKFRTKALGAVALSISLAYGGMAPAMAQDAPNDDAPPQTGLTAPVEGDVTTMAPISASPSGCYGQTDNPHRSGADSSVHGRTRCAVYVLDLGVTTTIFHLAWFGWNALESDSASRAPGNDSGDAHPHYPCSATTEQDFLGSSTHYSSEAGQLYTGTTSNEASFVC